MLYVFIKGERKFLVDAACAVCKWTKGGTEIGYLMELQVAYVDNEFYNPLS